MSARTWFVMALAVLVLGATYLGLRALTSSAPSAYPEFQAVSASELARVREALRPADGSAFDDPTESVPDVGAALDDCTPLAVLAVLHQRASEPTGTIEYGPCFLDARRRPVGVWLATRRDASLNDVLLRLAADEKIEFDLRDVALAAVCWDGNRAALPRLTELALDMDAEPIVRERALFRIPRIGTSPGPEFEALLYLPFRGHDEVAAAVLAVAGKPVAPSLVLDALRDASENPGNREHLLVRAAAAIAEGDPEVSQRARIAEEAIEAGYFSGRDQRGAAEQAVSDVTEALERWSTAHPPVRPSRFELERLAYRKSPRYQRERRVLEADDLSSVPEEDLDFAAAALRITNEEGSWRDGRLDALDRLGLLLLDEVKGAEDPRAKLQALHRRLLPRKVHTSSGIETGPSSFLYKVLRERAGNCVGLTSLYVALGERLDLPLVAVSIPGHVFLRWDDGEVVHDVELTAQGRLRSDDDLEGATPRVLTKRELLSVVLSNRSVVWLDSPWLVNEGRLERALGYADEALRYDASNEAAHLARARVMARLGNEEEALRSAQKAVDLDPTDVRGPIVAGESLLLLERPEEALAWFDRAREIDEESAAALHGRLACLTELGQHRAVLDEAVAFLEREDHRAIRLLRLRALVTLDRRGWEAELEQLAAAPPESWSLRTFVARLLLDRDDTRSALRVLAPLGDLEEAVRHAAGREDEARVIVAVPGRGILAITAGDLCARLQKVQALRAEAREKADRAARADEARSRKAD